VDTIIENDWKFVVKCLKTDFVNNKKLSFDSVKIQLNLVINID